MPRPLLFLFALLLAGAAGFFWWSRAEIAPAPQAPAEAPAPAAGAPAPVAGEAAAAVAPASAGAAARQDAAPAGAGDRLGGEPAVVGRVVDDQGAPVAGAQVLCAPGVGDLFGGGAADPAEIDWEEFAGFDPAAWASRAEALQRDRREARTDADGRFRVAAAGAGRTVQIRIAARGHQLLDRSAARPTAADTDLGDLALRRGAVVRGRVVTGDGQGLAGARVGYAPAAPRGGEGPFGRAFDGFGLDLRFPGSEALAGLFDPGSAVTAADGGFELAHVAPGPFALRASHPDHPAARRDGLEVPPGGELDAVVVTVAPGAVIRGRITGLPTPPPPLRVLASRPPAAEAAANPGLEGMAGLLGGLGEGVEDLLADFGGFAERTVLPAADGSFEFRGLEVGRTYRVAATQQGRGFAGNGTCTPRLEVAAGSEGIELRYDPGIAVTFRAVDARTGAPVEALWVRDTLRGGGGMADMMQFVPRGTRQRSYPDGKVTIANLRPRGRQTLQLAVEALGYAALQRDDLALPAQGQLDLGELRLQPIPVVRVLVRDADGKPAAGVDVALREAQPAGGRGDRNGDPMAMLGEFGARLPGGRGNGPRRARTGADGRCVLNAFPGAAAVLEATDRGHAPFRSEPFTVADGADAEQAVQLLRGGRVVVTVLDSRGEPVAEARVERDGPGGPGGRRGEQRTGRDGTAVFDRLAPGEHGFRLAPRGGRDFAAMAQRARGERGAASGPEWQRLAVADGASAALQLQKDPVASLRGVVRENGVPLAGARVQFLDGPGDGAADGSPEARVAEAIAGFGGGGGGGGRSARAGDDGAYQLRELPPGSHRLRVSSRDRALPSTVAVTLRAGENVFDVELAGTVLRGTVRDPAGQPVAGARVAVVLPRPAGGGGAGGDPMLQMVEEALPGGLPGGGETRSVRSDDAGRFELRGVPADQPLQVRASARGFAGALSAVVTVPAGGSRDGADVVLLAAGRIAVTAGQTGPFASARAVHLGADGAPVEGVAPVMQILRRGSGTLDGLRPGRWRVELVLPQGGERPSREVEVVAGATAAVAF